jgi:hypothetical protein
VKPTDMATFYTMLNYKNAMKEWNHKGDCQRTGHPIRAAYINDIS